MELRNIFNPKSASRHTTTSQVTATWLTMFPSTDNCRFEHPGASSNPFGGTNNNRFGALSSGGGGGSTTAANKYKITKESIRTDLADERPTWIMSAYGPGKDAPEQLFGGYPREQSFEELRLLVQTSPNPQQALQDINLLYQQAEQQLATTLENVDGAIQFLLGAENTHPNRNDICAQNSQQGGATGTFAVGANQAGGFGAAPAASQNPFSTAQSQSNPFGGGATSTPAASTGGFGQPSALGQKPNPFGSAAFGQPSQLGSTGSAPFGGMGGGSSGSAFGQPSQLGGNSGSAFGQPSQLGGTGTSAFGSPSPLGGAGPSAFGQPSQLGNTGGSAFGQPSQMGGSASAFGQPSQLGGAGGSAFGQTSALGAKPNPFGAPAASSGFAQAAQQTTSAFGQTSSLGQKPNPFGAAAASPLWRIGSGSECCARRKPPSSGAFGQPAAAANPFGSTSNPPADSAMDTTGPVPGAATAAPSNPFGQPMSNGTGVQAANPFGQPQAQPAAGAAPVAGAAAAAKGAPGNPYAPNSTKQHPPYDSYVNRMGAKLVRFKGQPVMYKDATTPGLRNPDGTFRKIWFPNGPPAYYRGTEPDDPASYTDDVKKAYADMHANGRFVGMMPDVPPLREDCVWDF
ncbi:CCCH zinc finger domain-containing protein [Apiospora arundinis]